VSRTDENAGNERPPLLLRALTLSYLSIGWGITSGTLNIVAGLRAGSLGVLGLGLNVLADVVGSVGLVWRFRVEQSNPALAQRAERRASNIVVTTLSIVALSLASVAIDELVTGSIPRNSNFALIMAGLATVVLLPLGLTKRRVGATLDSHALIGDGTLSVIGAVLGVVAMLGLLANVAFHWWWADRVAALGVAVVALYEARNVYRERPVVST